MFKINSLVIALCLGLMSGVSVADDSGANPGYVVSPFGSGSNSNVKTQYGECVKDGNYQPSYQTVACGATPAPAPQKISFSESSTNLFSFNAATLTNFGRQQLTNMLESATAAGSIDKVTISGYTDTIGSDAYNNRLSTERANAVKDFFIGQGLDGGTITAGGFGSQNSQVSTACIKKYGKDDMAEIDRLTAKEKTATAAEKKRMNEALAKFDKTHTELVNCTAADRRVEITIEQTKEVTE
jgi:outer membrane protein OmpA-like peptidoglycan-associated protein